MLSAADITAMRLTSQTITMTTPCTISRKTETPDGMGGFTDTWATVATTVCSVAPMPNQEREVIYQGKIGEINVFVIGLPPGTDVTIKDRITALGATYEVNNVKDPRTIEITLDLICSLLQ